MTGMGVELLTLLVGHYLAVSCEWSNLFGEKSSTVPEFLQTIEIQSDGKTSLTIPTWPQMTFSDFDRKITTQAREEGGCCKHSTESKFTKTGMQMKKNHYHNLFCIPRATYFSAKDLYKINVKSKDEIIVEYSGENYPDAKCTYKRVML
jgi:hypothetical protein